jgi:hypothetical protein
MAGYTEGLRVLCRPGQDPVAERLLRNLINFAANDLNKLMSPPPADFEEKLNTLGYD